VLLYSIKQLLSRAKQQADKEAKDLAMKIESVDLFVTTHHYDVIEFFIVICS
jgi:hypothetical protein